MDILFDALLDSLKILPFLLIIHIIIEVIEVRFMRGFKNSRLLGGKLAPLLGASAGVVPQCGFSVVATELYSSRNITIGTLMAVYIATSDEAIPILLSDPDTIGALLPIIGIKFAFALIVGFAADLIINRSRKNSPVPIENSSETGCCGHTPGEESEKGFKKYVLHPLLHSLKIFLYILIINIAFGYVLAYVGEERLSAALSRGDILQPILASLIGLIPNCASSVVITQMYALGGITLGSAVAGLSINSGVAFAVLFRTNKHIKENLIIIGSLFALSSLTGIIINLLI